MPLIDGFGDEIFTALLALVILLVIHLAWRTTRVPAIHTSYMLVRFHDAPHEVEVYAIQEEENATAALNGSAHPADQSVPLQGVNQLVVEESGDTASNESPADKADAVDQKLVVQLRFLDETHRSVSANLSQRIGDFKRENFANDLQEGKVIRLIYGGQLLRDDCRSLASYGLFDNCVVHCHVSCAPRPPASPQPETSTTTANQSPPSAGRSTWRSFQFDIGNGIYAIFSIKFVCLWAVLYFFPEYFDVTSLVSFFFCSCISLFLFTGVGRRRSLDAMQT